MSNIDPHHLTNIDAYSGPKTGYSRVFSLADDDCQQLERHLTQPDVKTRTFLHHVLRHKVRATRPLQGAAPKDVVTGTSCVRYTIDGGPMQIGLMSHWARSDARSGVVPVCSLLGAALIGMRIGERAPLLNVDGTISSLTVLDIIPQT